MTKTCSILNKKKKIHGNFPEKLHYWPRTENLYPSRYLLSLPNKTFLNSFEPKTFYERLITETQVIWDAV